MLASRADRLEDAAVNTPSTPRFFLAFVAVLALTQCRTATAPGDLDKPMFGGSHATAFVVETDRALKLGELAHAARVIGFYKELTPGEVAAVGQRLRREFDDLVAVEVQALRPGFDKQKAAMQTLHATTLEARKANPAVTARLVAKHEADLRKLEATMRQQARERVIARLGKDLALPLQTSDQRSVIALGRMMGEQFQVTSKAYEIDVAASKLAAGAVVTTLAGGKATVAGAAASVRVKPPQTP